MTTERGTYWLLYDGDCRICTAVAGWVDVLDVRNRIRIQPIQKSRELMRGIPSDEILDAMHMVSPDGRVTTGGRSLPTLLEALFSGPPLGDLLQSSTSAMVFLNRVYAVIVEFRGHLVCRFEAPALLPKDD